jgi:hypothetical protein
MSASAVCLMTEALVHGEKERRVDRDGRRISPVARSFSETAGPEFGIHFKRVCVGDTAGPRFRVAKDVPILRANHFPIEAFVPGVWEIARSSPDKIDGTARYTDEF